MATYHAIAAAGEALLRLLADACPKPEFAGAQFALYQAGDFQSAMEEGIALFLYRVTPNTSGHNLAPRQGPDGRRYRPPLALDLHYLVIPFAKAAEQQQHLLGWAMRTLEDTPILPPNLLNYHAPLAGTFRVNETVELVREDISIVDMANVWQFAQSSQRLAVPYVARMVAIESLEPLPEAAPVQTRDFSFAKGAP